MNKPTSPGYYWGLRASQFTGTMWRMCQVYYPYCSCLLPEEEIEHRQCELGVLEADIDGRFSDYLEFSDQIMPPSVQNVQPD